SFSSVLVLLTMVMLKIFSRTKIDIILEQKFKNKIYEFLEIVFICVIISSSITVFALLFNIELFGKVLFIIIFILFCFLFLLGLIIIVFSIIIYNFQNSLSFRMRKLLRTRLFKSRRNALEWFSLIFVMSMAVTNFGLIYDYSSNVSQNINQIITTSISFLIFYMITMILIKNISNEL